MDKATIKHNLLQHASKVWNLKPGEMDVMAFDPLVNFMSGGMANELEKAHYKIQHIESTLLNKLAKTLVPDVLSSVKPAHALVQANPIEPETTINYKKQFRYVKTGGEQQLECFFTPTGNYKLYNADISHVITNDAIYEINNRDRQLISKLECKPILSNRIFIGIETDSDVQHLKDVNIFFDWLRLPNFMKHYQLLQSASIYCNGKLLESSLGLKNLKQKINNGFDDLYATEQLIEDPVNALYNDFFIHLNDERNLEKELLPKKIKNLIPDDIINVFQTPKIWLEIEFKRPLSKIAQDNLTCYLNTFPISQRKFHTSQKRISTKQEYISIPCDNHFLYIESVSDYNDEYSEASTPNNQHVNRKTYFIERKSSQQFTPQDAQNKLNELMHLLREESHAFSRQGMSVHTEEMVTLRRMIKQLNNNRFNEKDDAVVINSNAIGELATVKYWSSFGELANRIPSGEFLSSYKVGELQNYGCTLLSSTLGGEAVNDEKQQLYKFKSALLSRGRMVSEKDIETACIAFLGDHVNQISIGRNWKNYNTKKGLQPVIDVKIYLKKHDEDEMNNALIQKSLQQFLDQHGQFVYPIEVKFVEE